MMTNQTSQKKTIVAPATSATAQTPKESPTIRAERAYEVIKQTVSLNERLLAGGLVSVSFGLKKTQAR